MRALPSLLYIIISQRPHLLKPSHWTLALQHMNLELGVGDTNSDYRSCQMDDNGKKNCQVNSVSIVWRQPQPQVRTSNFPSWFWEPLYLLRASPVVQTVTAGFNPWVIKVFWRREWWPTPVLFPGEFHRWRSLEGYSPWGCKESARTKRLTLSFCLGRTSLGWLAQKVDCWLRPVLRMNSYHSGLHHSGWEGDNASFISSLF